MQQEAEEEEEAVQRGTPLVSLAQSAEAGGRSFGSPGDPGRSPIERLALDGDGIQPPTPHTPRLMGSASRSH